MVTRPTKKAAAAAQKPDFTALLAAAKMPERIVPICLRGDLNAEHEALDRELRKLVDRPALKLGGDGRGELQQRIQDLEAEMADSTADIRLRAMPRRDWHALVADHPPRVKPNGDLDERDAIGVNAETFFVALVRKSTVDPLLDDEQWAAFLEALTDRQFDSLSDAAWGLNRRDVDVPFSHAAWRQSQSSADE